MKESFSLDVKKPRREVFDSLTDVHRLAGLSNGAVTISPVPDRPRAGKGAAFLIKPAVNGPGPAEVLCETTQWDPPSLCTRRFAIPDLPVTAALRFEDIEGGTRVTVDLELEPQSLLYKMMLPALALKLKSDKDKLLAQFQQELAKQPRQLP